MTVKRKLGIMCAATILPFFGCGTSPGTAVPVEISVSTELFPAFNANISDYVSRCIEGSPTVISVNAAVGTTVSVAGDPAQTGKFEVQVDRSSGQSFTIQIKNQIQSSQIFHVRCLPPDFQWWSVEKTGVTQAEWYQVSLRTDLPGARVYPAIYDNNGVPIWWAKSDKTFLFAQLFSNNNFGFIGPYGAYEISLDGGIIRHFRVQAWLDHHDMALLPNGNYLVVETVGARVDLLNAWGSGYESDALVTNHILREIDFAGNIVWSWDTLEHIPVTETPVQWRNAQENGYDAYHWNSIEPTENGVIVSFRNLNAVYNIDRTTGNILWKLGGTARAESLTVLRDPFFSSGGNFGGQHDVRLLEDGTLSLHENGTGQRRPPRAVRYRINAEAKTASLLEYLSDPLVVSSGGRGSARKLPGGNWVIGFGSSPMAAEMTSDGTRVFTLEFQGGATVYRAIPLQYGVLDRAELRAGMDVQYSN